MTIVFITMSCRHFFLLVNTFLLILHVFNIAFIVISSIFIVILYNNVPIKSKLVTEPRHCIALRPLALSYTLKLINENILVFKFYSVPYIHKKRKKYFVRSPNSARAPFEFAPGPPHPIWYLIFYICRSYKIHRKGS